MIDDKFISTIDHLHKYKEYSTLGDYRKALYHLNHIKDELEGLYGLTLAKIEEYDQLKKNKLI